VLDRGELLYAGGLEAIVDNARHHVWEVAFPAAIAPPIAREAVLSKKRVGESILYRYYAERPLPGSTPVEATFEDAYIALLMRHAAARRLRESSESGGAFGAGSLRPMAAS
jgi:hypothetical protein